MFITHKIPPQSKSRNLSPGFIGSKPDRCVPDWQYNAADSGSNASVSCVPGIPALFKKQQNIHQIIQQKNMNENPFNNLKQNSHVYVGKGNNKITELRTILQRESQNS